ncbi:M20/M25/M40 family metallo-hydrolase [Cetobacterium sp. 2A]|uniref:M20/M25/M40 family metallo-hydrolase n=1 Tax=Cetobacterium sp. 2A TaxID=2754723 RepID=UPI00163C6A09|nr:M20/M25/M40 family metallo-hydrolase [Cetobacterium sp. 2A]MBC2856656.1 M20/M25/M40 family metallo-hydrolase [Cetobacterium sp. 2A]
MNYNLKKAFEFIEENEKEMQSLWIDLCKIESPSIDTDNVNLAINFLEKKLIEYGMKTKIYEFSQGPNSLTAFFDNGSNHLEMAILGHLDTVHKKGLFGEEVVKIDFENDTIYGPGVLDCKGGVIVGALVARALNHINYDKIVKLAFSGDEEVGHRYTLGEGKQFFLNELKGFKTCIDCETGFVDGRVVTGRKGTANFKITIKGKAAHSGNEPQNGVSSIKEAAYKTINIEKNNDFNSIHYNVGVIEGGTSQNTIPEYCTMTVNVRFKNLNDLDKIKSFLTDITNTSFVDGTTSEITQISLSDPMEQTKKNLQLFELLKTNSEKLGFGTPYSCHLGGGSDAAYSVTLGIPTVCGMGVKGYENHTIRERALLSSLVERSKLILQTILTLPETFEEEK